LASRFPQANYPQYSSVARDVFTNSTIETTGIHGWSTGHSDYNRATAELAERFCRANDVTPDKMTADQARNLVHLILESDDPRIRDFLTAETGIGDPYNPRYQGG